MPALGLGKQEEVGKGVVPDYLQVGASHSEFDVGDPIKTEKYHYFQEGDLYLACCKVMASKTATLDGANAFRVIRSRKVSGGYTVTEIQPCKLPSPLR